MPLRSRSPNCNLTTPIEGIEMADFEKKNNPQIVQAIYLESSTPQSFGTRNKCQLFITEQNFVCYAQTS